MLFKTKHICLTVRCMSFGVECLGWLCCAYSFTHIQLFVTLWTVAFQAPLSMEIFQARTLEWIATPSSKGSSQPSDWIHIACIAGGFVTIWATAEALSFFAFCYWQPTPVCFPGEFHGQRSMSFCMSFCTTAHEIAESDMNEWLTHLISNKWANSLSLFCWSSNQGQCQDLSFGFIVKRIEVQTDKQYTMLLLLKKKVP